MTRYRVTFKGRITRTYVGRTAADVLHEVWSGYREWLVGPKIDIDEERSEELASIPITRAVFDVSYAKDIEADTIAQAVRDFVGEGQAMMIVTLAFSPLNVSIEEVKA